MELGVVEFDMIYLMTDDLKSALIKITRQHILKLLNVLIDNHRAECKKQPLKTIVSIKCSNNFNFFLTRVCEDFEKIKARALKRPETTEELNDMVKFIDHAKTTGIVNLGTQIKDLKKAMAYLLDTH